jgi:hypothetical protein
MESNFASKRRKTVKKIFLTGLGVFVLIFAAVNAFAIGDINAKAGLGTGLIMTGSAKDDGPISDTELIRDFHIGGEYLYPINETMKVGGGLFYMSATKDPLPLIGDDVAWSYLPIYGTFQINPFPANIFFKVNLGFVAVASIDWGKDKGLFSDDGTKGGIYFSISVGRDFVGPWFGEISFSNIGSSVDAGITNVNFSYNRIGATVGYRFEVDEIMKWMK